MCKQHLLKTRFWRVAKFDVEMTKMVLSFPWQFGMSLCCLRMCMLDNKLQTFFNLVLFQQLCGRELCGDGFCVFTACCMFFFFGRRPLPFGGSPLEAYSRTSGESNHHRQSVRVVKNDALRTELRGHLHCMLSTQTGRSQLRLQKSY